MLGLERSGKVVIIHQRNGENRFNQDSIAEWHAILDKDRGVIGAHKHLSYGRAIDLLGATRP